MIVEALGRQIRVVRRHSPNPNVLKMEAKSLALFAFFFAIVFWYVFAAALLIFYEWVKTYYWTHMNQKDPALQQWDLFGRINEAFFKAYKKNRIDSMIETAKELALSELGITVSFRMSLTTLKQRLEIETEQKQNDQNELTTEKSIIFPLEGSIGQSYGEMVVLSGLKDHQEKSCQSLALVYLSKELSRTLEHWLQLHASNKEIESLRGEGLSTNQKLRHLQLFYDIEKSFAESLEVSDFLDVIFVKLMAFTNAKNVFVVCQEGSKTPRAYSWSDENSEVALIPDRPIYKKQSFGIRIKSGFSCEELTDIMGLGINNHIGVPFHCQEEDQGEISDLWGRIELINHPSGFGDQDLSFLNLVADKVTAAFVRERLLAKKASSQRLATIGQLSSSIIHDFRNPMTSIRGFAELIKISGETMGVDQRIKICTIIMNQVDRCTNMIEELLSFARGDKKYQFEPCKMDTFMNELAELIKVETEKKGIDLQFHFGCDLVAHIDRDKMMRVILNLTNNSLEILEDGETLKISSQINQSGHIEIRVEDTGPGVPKELRSNLFDAFVTHGKESGTGLGLHISKDIVEAHGGILRLDEDYNDGAAFVVSFPVSMAGVREAS